MDYTDGAWTNPRIEPAEPVALHPSAAVLHYAQAIIEGLKAFRGVDGQVRCFRLLDHCRRFAASAELMAMPPVDPAFLAGAIRQLVAVDDAWVPAEEGSALYVRPVMFATEPLLNVRPALAYTCLVLTAPVESFYGGDRLRPVRLWVERRRIRAAPGGIGAAKAAANYAATLPLWHETHAAGYDQVLWLDAIEHRYLEEAGTMNVFVRIGDLVRTAPVSGTILDGITRRSVLTLLRDWGVRVEERAVALDEVTAAVARGEDVELFGSGTAAVVAPVGVLGTAEGDVTIGDGTPGRLTRRLYEAITDIQYGRVRDAYGWMG